MEKIHIFNSLMAKSAGPGSEPSSSLCLAIPDLATASDQPVSLSAAQCPQPGLKPGPIGVMTPSFK